MQEACNRTGACYRWRGDEFADDYETKGYYTYDSSKALFEGIAFFGGGGTKEDMTATNIKDG